MNSIHYHKVRSGMNAFITEQRRHSQQCITPVNSRALWWPRLEVGGSLWELLVKIISPIIKCVWRSVSQHLCVLMVSHQASSGQGFHWSRSDKNLIPTPGALGALTVIHFPQPQLRFERLKWVHPEKSVGWADFYKAELQAVWLKLG